jgi:hypothetical protein
MKMAMFTLIDMNIIPCQCGICDFEWEEARSVPSFGVARYEDECPPDDYEGEWGGMMVCEACYRAERSLRQEYPDVWITFRSIKAKKDSMSSPTTPIRSRQDEVFEFMAAMG